MSAQPMFHTALHTAQHARNSWLCVGLDPIHSDNFAELDTFLRAIIDATAEFASAYKPNLGYFLARGKMGLDLLDMIRGCIPRDLPLILDGKFGDIGPTAAHYARFAFDHVAADAVTLAPYVGSDAITPFLPNPAKGVFILCRTSNLNGNEFQAVGDPPLYQQVAARAVDLAADYPGQIGLVVGATQLSELASIRAAAPGLPFLVPGIGAQGGDLAATVQHGATIADDPIGPVITIGRAILYASQGDDFASAAAQQARHYRDQINQLRGTS